jgi:hypothetical protein
MMRRILFGVIVTFACPAIAGAQDSLSLSAIDPAAAERLRAIIETTRAKDLPVDPIVGKVRFALTLHAPSAKIVAAAGAVARRLEVARDALAPRPAPNEIVAGENALSEGIGSGVLRKVREASRDRSVEVPLGVLAQLVATGVPVDQATETVTNLIRRGANNRQLVALGDGVERDMSSGERADLSIKMRLQPLNAVLAPTAAAGGLSTAIAGPVMPKKP